MASNSGSGSPTYIPKYAPPFKRTSTDKWAALGDKRRAPQIQQHTPPGFIKPTKQAGTTPASGTPSLKPSVDSSSQNKNVYHNLPQLYKPDPTKATPEFARQEAATHNTQSIFIKLPGEIRNLIYRFCLELAAADRTRVTVKAAHHFAGRDAANTFPPCWKCVFLCPRNGKAYVHGQLAERREPFSLTQVCQLVRTEFTPLFWEKRHTRIDLSYLGKFLNDFGDTDFPAENLYVVLGKNFDFQKNGEISGEIFSESIGFYKNKKIDTTPQAELKRTRWARYADKYVARMGAAISTICGRQIHIHYPTTHRTAFSEQCEREDGWQYYFGGQAAWAEKYHEEVDDAEIDSSVRGLLKYYRPRDWRSWNRLWDEEKPSTGRY